MDQFSESIVKQKHFPSEQDSSQELKKAKVRFANQEQRVWSSLSLYKLQDSGVWLGGEECTQRDKHFLRTFSLPGSRLDIGFKKKM